MVFDGDPHGVVEDHLFGEVVHLRVVVGDAAVSSEPGSSAAGGTHRAGSVRLVRCGLGAGPQGEEREGCETC